MPGTCQPGRGIIIVARCSILDAGFSVQLGCEHGGQGRVLDYADRGLAGGQGA